LAQDSRKRSWPSRTPSELCVVESGLWIARRKGCGVCGDPPRRSRSHPIQNGHDSFLRRRKVWNNRVGIPVEIPSNGELPDSGINDGKERKGKQQVRAPPDRAKNGMARFRRSEERREGKSEGVGGGRVG